MSSNLATQVRSAWERGDTKTLINLLRLAHGPQWRSAATQTLAVLADLNAPVRDVLTLGQAAEQELRTRRRPTDAFLWRLFAVPRILHLAQATKAEDLPLFAYTAGAPLPEDWQVVGYWVDAWVEDVVGKYAQAPGEFNLSAGDDFGLTRPPTGTPAGAPPAVHPLVLAGLARALTSPQQHAARAEVAAALARWLVEQAVVPGAPLATPERTFAAGATLLQLALANDVQITAEGINGPAQWADAAGAALDAVFGLAATSPAPPRAGTMPPAHIVRLLEEGPLWHRGPIAATLRARAGRTLDERMPAADKALAALDAVLTTTVFAPKFDAAAPIALPDRRAAVDPVRPIYTDAGYLRLLNAVGQAETTVARQTDQLRSTAAAAQAAYGALLGAVANPLATAALVEKTQSQTPGSHRLVVAALRQGLAGLPLKSPLYGGEPTWRQSSQWQAAVNAPAPLSPDDASLDSVLAAWGELDRWEGWRGAGETLFAAEAQNAGDNPLQELPLWLAGGEEPPKKWDAASPVALRADLAAATLLGQPPAIVERLRANLQALLRGDLPEAWRAALAAAWLDLGITLAAKGGPSAAFPQLADIKDGLPQLSQYITWALAADDAWASRTGMQALVLLARIAELTGDRRLAAAIVQLSTNRPAAVARRCLAWLLGGSGGKGSALPLALVAADLLRYHGGRSAAITPAMIEAPPAWLPANAGVRPLLAQLAARFIAAPRTCLDPFVDDLPARRLMLAVQRIQLEQFQRDRRLVVRPAGQAEVQPLWDARGAVRAVYGGDALVQFGIPSADGEAVPWWNTNFWQPAPSGRRRSGPPQVETSALPLLNWVDTASAAASASVALMAEAGALDAATPPLPPAPIAPTAKLVIRYQDPWLWDVDGRYEGEFPEVSWKAARDQLAAAHNVLSAAEGRFTTALEKQGDAAWKAQVQRLLSQPLLLDTADFRQQIEAAVADLQEAEADLAAAQEESLAAEFEKHAAGLIYEAAKLELSRQGVLEQVTKLDQQVAALEQEIAALEAKRAEAGVDQAKIDVEIAGKRLEQAEIELQKAALGRNSILEEIEALRRILGAPLKLDGTPDDPEGKYQIAFTGADGVARSANGQIAAMAISLEGTISQKLAESLAEANKELAEEEAEERKRKKKSFWGKIVKAVCKVIGTVVGAVLGGPAGAALGAALGEALGELGAGMIEGKPIEAILLGLVDNAFDIAGAAGLNLEAELNKLGGKAIGEIKSVFKTIDSKLGAAFDDLPRIFGEEIFTNAFYLLGIDQEVPELADLAKKAYGQLRSDLGGLEERYHEAGGLGTILKGASRFDSLDQIRKALTDVVINEVFAETKKDIQKMGAVARALGMQVAELATPAGQEDAATRFGTLVLSNMVTYSYEGRQQILASWIKSVRDLGLNWSSDDVRKQAKLLLADLFPNSEVRAQVEGSIRQALADPAVMRGRIYELLQTWQGKLDVHLADMQKEPAGADQVRTKLDLARIQVKFLQDAQTTYQNNLLPFLKSEQGHSDERDALYRQLDAKQQELEQQNLTIESLALEGEIRNGELDKAQIGIARAEIMLAQARKSQQINELNVEKSSLLNQAATLAKLSQENITGAQEQASKAADARARAAAARVNAARAAVTARRARLDAAAARGAEAAAIRISLAAPPPPLIDIAGAEVAGARADHARALDDALQAYRELLRFYYSIRMPEAKIPTLARPDLVDAADQTLTWAGALGQFLRAVGERFTLGAAQQRVPEPITWDLSPAQIGAITSPSGLRIIVGPQEEEKPIYFLAGAAYSSSLPTGVQPVDLPPPWRALFAEQGVNLAAKTLVRAERRAIGPPIRWQIYEAEPSAGPQEVILYTDVDGATTPFYTWTLERTEALGFSVRLNAQDKSVQVCRNQLLDINTKTRSPLDDRFLEWIEEKKARTGRMVGLFLTMYDRNTGSLLTDSDYSMFVEHLGDVWFSRREVRLYRPRTSDDLGGRFHFIAAEDKPLEYLKNRVDFAALEGDPDILSVQGMPLSGTLILRLLPQGEREFERVQVRLLYKVYE
jgi:hypothetical protein